MATVAMFTSGTVFVGRQLKYALGIHTLFQKLVNYSQWARESYGKVALIITFAEVLLSQMLNTISYICPVGRC